MESLPVKQKLPIVYIRGVPMAFDKSTGNYWLGNTPLNTSDGSMSMWLKDQAGNTDYYIVDNAKPSIQKSAVIRQVSGVKNNPAKAAADFKSILNSSPVMQANIQQGETMISNNNKKPLNYMGYSTPEQAWMAWSGLDSSQLQDGVSVYNNMVRKNIGLPQIDNANELNFGLSSLSSGYEQGSNFGFDLNKYSMPELGSYSDAWNKGGFSGLWDRLTSSKGGTVFNPGKSDLEMGISGLSALAGLYGAYKQNEYSEKMRQLAERQQSMYEQQIADQNRRRDLAQSNYNRAMGV